MRGSATTAIILVLLAAGTVAAQEVTTELTPDDRWTVTIAPYLWATTLDGDASVGRIDADVDLPFSDIVQDLAFGTMLLVDIQKDRFGIAVNTVFARVSPDGDVGPISIDATTDMLHIGVGPYYRVVDWTYRRSASGKPLRLRIEPTAGARVTYLRAELEVRGGSTVDQSETWVDPLVGSRFALDLADRWTLIGEADIGGFGVGSDLAWNAQAFLGYQTSLFGRPTTFALGYRALHQDYESGNFAWDVTMHGPVLGLAMHF